ncbi:MAG: glycosyltransferase, partial [Acidisphaera sp.]|nr:glycosyltransferase [Acidisphaera sp.]
MNPEISLVIGGFDMARELPRTLRSLSPGMQRGLGGTPYDILVVDNGSPAPFDAASCRSLGLDLRVDRIAAADASPSPVRAL